VSYASTIEILVRYRAQRLPMRLFAPLAVFVSGAALVGSGQWDLAGYAMRACTALSLVAQFRLWDDLESVERDRLLHPERLLCQIRRRRPLYLAVAAHGAINLALVSWLAAEWVRPVLLVALVLAYWLGYRTSGRFGLGRLFRAHLVLVKYPLFVLVLSPPAPTAPASPLLLAALLVFVCMGIYEILHDPEVASSRGAAGVLLAQCLVMVGALTLLAGLHAQQEARWAAGLALQWATVAAGAALASAILRSSRSPREPLWGYSLFLASYAAMVAYP
jgi:uncharacterized membrane protein YoaK (UPF0700 family)